VLVDIVTTRGLFVGVLLGSAPVDAEVDPGGWAHSEQNLAVGESCAPQLAQARDRGAAHSSQNFAAEWLSCRQRGYFTAEPPRDPALYLSYIPTHLAERILSSKAAPEGASR